MTARCSSSPNPDRSRFLVACRHNGKIYWAERDDADCDRAGTEADIKSGQFPTLFQVLEVNPVEGICRDVTDEFAALIDDPEPCGRSIEHKWDAEREQRKTWEG